MTSSAAERAAKALMGANRNRPSRHMSQVTSLSALSGLPSSSMTSGGGSGTEESSSSYPVESSSSSTDRDRGGGGPTSSSSSPGVGGGGGPSFMNHLQSQYESLSERLAREVASSTNVSGTASPLLPKSGSRRGKSPGNSSRRVRWAEMARIASTVDADRANNVTDDDDDMPRSPMEALADLFQRRYTLPIFLLLTTAIFLLVHLSGGPNDDGQVRYNGQSSSSSSSLGETSSYSSQRGQSPGGIPGGITRSGGIEGDMTRSVGIEDLGELFYEPLGGVGASLPSDEFISRVSCILHIPPISLHLHILSSSSNSVFGDPDICIHRITRADHDGHASYHPQDIPARWRRFVAVREVGRRW
jgi:hypothetical protein